MAYLTLGEVRLFAGTYAPLNWEFCSGQILPISEYTALYGVIGTSFGGDGVKTFGLPDLRGRVPIHQGQGTVVGDAGGSETVSLTEAQLPGHTHAVGAGGTASTPKPQGGFWAQNGAGNTAPYSMGQDGSVMAASAVTVAGAGAPHDNMQPFLALNYIICTSDGDATTEPFIGEVRAFAAGLPPGGGWALCNGQLLSTRTYAALMTLIGNLYGGDVKSETIATPNLLDCVAVGAGQGPNLTKRDLAATGGANSVALVGNQLAAHSHAASCTSAAGSVYGPSGAYWAKDPAGPDYEASGSDRMATGAFGFTGGNGAHENRQPFLAMNYAIAVSGLYPTRP